MRKRRKYFASIAVIILIAAFSVALKVTKKEEAFAGDVLMPIQKTVSALESDISEIIKHYTDYEVLEEENTALRSELSEARETMARLYSLEEENDILREKLEIHDTAPSVVLTEANIISSLSGLQLDKGKNDGAEEYMAVVTCDGLLGYIGYCGDSWSNITLISSKSFTCGGCNPRTHEKGILSGDGEKLYLTCLLSTSQTSVGDLIVTDDGTFPGGMTVGKVKDIYDEENGLSKTAEIEALAELDDIKRAYIVTGTDDEIM